MKLTLGPLQYFWQRAEVLDFYQQALDWPVSVLYLGETVCSKRREMRLQDWLSLARQFAAQGREVILSSLALLEAESELSSLTRLVDNGHFQVEANDWSAVQRCVERQLPFVAGPTLNLYNHEALAFLQTLGMTRFVLGIDQGSAALHAMRQQADIGGRPFPEVEVLGWGRMPLAYSARCFTARARNLGKDECGTCCREYPHGFVVETREQTPFLCINGIQVQSAAYCDLGPELESLREAHVDFLRISPQQENLGIIIRHFAEALAAGKAAPRQGDSNGFWHGKPGQDWIDAAQRLSPSPA